MEKEIIEENEDSSEIIEEAAEKQKTLTPQQIINQSKAPFFNNANRFNKAAQWNNINNRQRPGRAASRWR